MLLLVSAPAAIHSNLHRIIPVHDLLVLISILILFILARGLALIVIGFFSELVHDYLHLVLQFLQFFKLLVIVVEKVVPPRQILRPIDILRQSSHLMKVFIWREER